MKERPLNRSATISDTYIRSATIRKPTRITAGATSPSSLPVNAKTFTSEPATDIVHNRIATPVERLRKSRGGQTRVIARQTNTSYDLTPRLAAAFLLEYE